MSRHITAKSKMLETVMTEVVDAAGIGVPTIGGKRMLLPGRHPGGEVSPNFGEKSQRRLPTEVIVAER